MARKWMLTQNDPALLTGPSIHAAALSIQDGPDPRHNYRGSAFHWAVADLLFAIDAGRSAEAIHAAASTVASTWERPW